MTEGRAGMPWYRWSPRDFRSDAAVFQMDREQRWRYRDALDDSWLSGTPGVGSEDQWRKWLGYSAVEWPAVRSIFAAAFVVGGSVWTQKRLAAEAVRALERSRKGTAAIQKRWAGREKPSQRIPGEYSENTQPIPNLYSSHTDLDSRLDSKAISSPSGTRDLSKNGKIQTFPEGFVRFWDAYACARRTGKPFALNTWKSLKCEAVADEVLAELERFKRSEQWAGGFMPEPMRWLKKTPWVDGPTAEKGGEEW